MSKLIDAIYAAMVNGHDVRFLGDLRRHTFRVRLSDYTSKPSNHVERVISVLELDKYVPVDDVLAEYIERMSRDLDIQRQPQSSASPEQSEGGGGK